MIRIKRKIRKRIRINLRVGTIPESGRLKLQAPQIQSPPLLQFNIATILLKAVAARKVTIASINTSMATNFPHKAKGRVRARGMGAKARLLQGPGLLVQVADQTMRKLRSHVLSTSGDVAMQVQPANSLMPQLLQVS